MIGRIPARIAAIIGKTHARTAVTTGRMVGRAAGTTAHAGWMTCAASGASAAKATAP